MIMNWLRVFLSLALLFSLNCRTAVSQENANAPLPEIQKPNEVSTDSKTNSKYKLTISFGIDAKAESRIVTIRNEITGKEFIFYNLVETFTDISWSDDDEYFVMSNSYALYIYKSSNLVKSFNDPKVKADNFFEKTKTTDEISILDKNKTPKFRHTFLEWKNSASIIFEITYLEWNEEIKNNVVSEFRYDFVKKQLYRQIRQEDVNLSPKKKQKYIGLPPFLGKNKSGLIYQSNVKTEIID